MTRKESVTKSARAWNNMKQRCYSEKYQTKYPTYIGCYVCEEWLNYDTFKEWFNKNYVEGYVLDKDILVEGNKVYSPQTCCFVPQMINNLYKAYTDKEVSDTGVFQTGNTYEVKISKFGRRCAFGSFYDKECASQAYQNAKKDYKIQLADIYESTLDNRVYKILKC